MKPLKEFDVRRETKGGVQLLHLTGPLDEYSFKHLQGVLQHVQSEEKLKLVLECDNLDHISASAITSLVEFARQFREANGQMVLVRVPEKIAEIIVVLGHSPEFKFLDSVKDALKLLAPDFKEDQASFK